MLSKVDRPLVLDGSPLEVLRTLRTLLPDAPSGRGLALLYHQRLLLKFLAHYPYVQASEILRRCLAAGLNEMALDEVSILAAATARELQRLQQEEVSDIISCVVSRTSFSKVCDPVDTLIAQVRMQA